MKPKDNSQASSPANTKLNSTKKVSTVSSTKMSYRIVIVILLVVLAMLLGVVLTNMRNPLGRSSNVILSEQNATIDIAKKVSPSVVSITTTSSGRDVFGRSVSGESAGTGIIISRDGLILTNKHVVEDSSSLAVVDHKGKRYSDVKIIAQDPSNDIAFIRVNGAGDLTPAELGDSSSVQVGSFVVAIGNALGQFQNTVTTGVISGKSRPITASDGAGSEQLSNLFQTDAAINPGNSGGPLVNIEGKVIGINTAVAGSGSENIGFAIPINEARADIESLQKNGRIVRAFLGVRYAAINAEVAEANGLNVDYGAYVSGVQASSPAESAKLQNGDIILSVNGTKIDDSNSLSSVLRSFKPGQKVELTILRAGKQQDVVATLGEAPQQ